MITANADAAFGIADFANTQLRPWLVAVVKEIDGLFLVQLYRGQGHCGPNLRGETTYACEELHQHPGDQAPTAVVRAKQIRLAALWAHHRVGLA